MGQISIRFDAELNDFLPATRRGRQLDLPLERRASVKDLVESLGVPHTEVELILANGESVDFSAIVRHGDRIEVFPFSTADSAAPEARVALRPPPQPRFVLDGHLGKLAGLLRMLGFDTLYQNDWDDETLARIAASQGRILLTQDRGLLKRSIVTHGYLVRSAHPEQQLDEVLRRYHLAATAAPFRRCMRCNGLLEPVDKTAILNRLEPKTRRYYHEFRACAVCGRIYWKGSHHDQMRGKVEWLLRENGA